jgi:DNA polymerase III epsilon subunit-like protein
MSFSQHGSQDMVAPFDALREVAVVDCETTGLDPEQDRIIRLAVVVVDLGVHRAEAQTWEATVSPRVPISEEASAVHDITDGEVEGLGTFGDIAESLTDFIGDRPLVGFNVGFDKRMLNAELERYGFKSFHDKRSYCVQEALHGIWGYAPTLSNAVARMTLTDFLDKLHDPLTDATATATMAGMIARLSSDQVRDAPGHRWTAHPRANDPPTEDQLSYIRSLGGSTFGVRTREQAGNAIERLEHEPDDSLDEDDDSPGCLPQLVVALFLVVLVAMC